MTVLQEMLVSKPAPQSKAGVIQGIPERVEQFVGAVPKNFHKLIIFTMERKVLLAKVSKKISKDEGSSAVKLIQEFAKEEKKNRAAANKDLDKLLTNKYFKHIPVAEIKEILKNHAFNPDPLDGVYTGDEGKIHEKVGEKSYIVITWYKMESGNFEVISYLS
jgi:hypothetical protein